MIRLQVHFRDQVYDVDAGIQDSVSSLLPTEGNKSGLNAKYFLKNGQALLPSFSLGFYHLTDNCEVYIQEPPRIQQKKSSVPQLYVPKKFRTARELLNTETRGKVFYDVLGFVPDRETMQMIVDEITDPDVSLEAARIKDKQFLKVEATARSHRLVMNRFDQYQRKQLLENSASLPSSSSNSTNSPSADVLPAFWEVKEKIDC